VVKKREFSAEKSRFGGQEERAREVRERKRCLESHLHQEKVDGLQRRPCEVSSASEDTPAAATEKREAQVERAKLVLWRKSQLEKIRLSRLLHEQKLKEAKERPRKKLAPRDEAHIKQVQENKCRLTQQRQKDAELGLQCRNHLAEARIEEVKKKQEQASKALKLKTNAAVERVQQNNQQIKLRERQILERELQVNYFKKYHILSLLKFSKMKYLIIKFSAHISKIKY